MNRREFVHSAGAASVVLGMSRSLPAEKEMMAKKPNILLIFSDQQHWQAMGIMDPFFETPNLDALAKESMIFTRSFCTTPQCSPSRSSLLTGFYPSTTTVMGNTGATGGNHLAQPTIASEFQSAGYRTGYFGKWYLGSKEVACSGWDSHEFKTDDRVAECGAVDFLKDPFTKTKPFALFASVNNPHDIYHFKRHNTRDEQIPLPESWEQETFERKPVVQEQFMTSDQGRALHGKPREEWEKYRDCYREKTRLYDQNVGVILDELKKQGQWDNTIVIVTSDHGDMDAQHKLIFKGPFMYEHMMRIPLMIRVPDSVEGFAPKIVDNVDVVNVDIVPTLRDLCGLASKDTHGMSLSPLLTGEDDYEPREFVVGQYYSKQRWINPIRTIRTENFKLSRYIRWGDELYDLKKDPHELKNLADDPQYAEVKNDLAMKLDDWIKDHDDKFYSQKVTTRKGLLIDE